jgi:hypothetical protein
MSFKIYLFIAMSFSLVACNQSNRNQLSQGIVQYTIKEHNFGILNQNDSASTYRFVFKNIGTEALFIKDVKSSCGCTSPNWSKEAIEPGENGYIEAKFDPKKSKPGFFSKSLFVETNTLDSTTNLFISGVVVEHIKSIEEKYKDTIGNLRIESRMLNWGDVFNKEAITKTYKIYNTGDKSIRFLTQSKLAKDFSISFDPKILAPKMDGSIIITFDANKHAELGYFRKVIQLQTDDKKSPQKDLYFSATVNEYFRDFTAQELLEAPKFSVNKISNNLGNVKKGNVVSGNFILKNEGKTPLIIRNLQPSCYCTKAEISKKRIQPNDTAIVNVSYNSEDSRIGEDVKTITIYNNDPTRSSFTLSISTTVVK